MAEFWAVVVLQAVSRDIISIRAIKVLMVSSFVAGTGLVFVIYI